MSMNMKAIWLNVRCKIRSFVKDEKAAEIIEYAIVVAIAAAAAVIIYQIWGSSEEEGLRKKMKEAEKAINDIQIPQ